MEHFEYILLCTLLLQRGGHSACNVTSAKTAQHEPALTGFNLTVLGPHVSTSDYDFYTSAEEALSGLFTACSSTWDHVVVFSNTECTEWCGLEQRILRRIGSLGITAIHYDFAAALENIDQIVLNSYVQQHIANFLWILVTPGNFIHDVDRIIRNNSISSLIPNRVNFLFLGCRESFGDFQNHFQNFFVDNVAIFIMEKAPVSKVDGYTLMWRQHRRREFEPIIHSSSKRQGKICSDFFPNTKFKLNGRDIVGLAKQYRPYIYQVRKPATGRLEYSGFFVQFAQLLAETLNFTLILYPEAGEDDRITWDEYSEIVARGEVDFGAVCWITNSVFNYNHTVGYPFLLSDIIGVYSKKGQPEMYAHFKLYHYQVYAVVGASIIYIAVISIVITSISSKFDLGAGKVLKIEQINWTGETNLTLTSSLQVRNPGVHRNKAKIYCDKPEQISHVQFKTPTCVKTDTVVEDLSPIEHDNIADARLDEATVDQMISSETSRNLHAPSRKAFMGLCDQPDDQIENNTAWPNNTIKHSTTFLSENSDSRLCPSCCSQTSLLTIIRRVVKQFADYAFRFLGSVLNQCILPKPEQVSVRLLIWVWSLMLIALTAGYTGNVTAFLVDGNSEESFNTFEDMMNAGGYKWGVESYSSLVGVMGEAREGSTLKRLYDGLMEFSRTDPTTVGQLGDLIAKARSEKFVALVYKQRFDKFMEYRTYTDLRIIGEVLIPIKNALIFPQISELRHLFSEQILKIVESGIVYFLHDVQSKLGSSIKKSNPVPQQSSLDIQHVLGTFYVAAGGILLATFAIVVECIYAKLLLKRGHRR